MEKISDLDLSPDLKKDNQESKLVFGNEKLEPKLSLGLAQLENKILILNKEFDVLQQQTKGWKDYEKVTDNEPDKDTTRDAKILLSQGLFKQLTKATEEEEEEEASKERKQKKIPECFRVHENELAAQMQQLHYDKIAEKLKDLQEMIDSRTKYIRELQAFVIHLTDIIEESERKIGIMRGQNSQYANKIVMLKKMRKHYNSMKTKIVRLQEIVTGLEIYVREHNLDALKEKLQDRECKIEQLKNQIVELKEILRFQEHQSSATVEMDLSEDKIKEEVKQTTGIFSKKDTELQKLEPMIIDEEQNENPEAQLQKEKQKIKEMQHDISEKNNRIEKYEEQVAEQECKIIEMEETIAHLKQKLLEIEDVSEFYKTLQDLKTENQFLKDAHTTRVNTIEKLLDILLDKNAKEDKLRADNKDIVHKLKDTSAKLNNTVFKLNDTANMLNEANVKLEEQQTKFNEKKNFLEAQLKRQEYFESLQCVQCQYVILERNTNKEELIQLREKINVFLSNRLEVTDNKSHCSKLTESEDEVEKIHQN